MEIKMEKVVSSNVDSIGFNEQEKICRIKFLDGRIYDYSNFTNSTFQSLKTAESIGGFINKNLRYSGKRVI